MNKEKDSLFDARSRIEVSLFDCPSSGSGIAGGELPAHGELHSILPSSMMQEPLLQI